MVFWLDALDVLMGYMGLGVLAVDEIGGDA